MSEFEEFWLGKIVYSVHIFLEESDHNKSVDIV